MEYFYTPPHLVTHNNLTIEGDEFAHLTHVMRKRVGDMLLVVDGAGQAYEVVIEEITRRTARCSINSRHERLHEPGIAVTLAVALLKNAARFDILVEKAAEIGVVGIVPLLTKRTIPEHPKTERWQKLALAAMKQSGRCLLPNIHEPVSLTDFVHTSPASSLKFIPHEQETARTISSLLNSYPSASAVICIGPEGGFTNEEIAVATGAGFHTVSLGPRRLRTETAAIVASAAVILNSPAQTRYTA